MMIAAIAAANDAGKAGPLGLLIVVLLGVAIVFLGRSMQKHLRRVPDRFEEKDNEGRTDGADSAK